MLNTVNVTIANGASLSGAGLVNGDILVGIVLPATWTAANLTFQASIDGVTYNNVYDKAGTEMTAVAAASRFVSISPADWAGMKYLKVRSGTAATAVNQAGDRIIGLVLSGID